MPPCLILKRDGTTLYPTRDIAAAVYRYNTFNFDRCIYVTSAGQSLHFAQWFKVVELMGYPWADEACPCAIRHYVVAAQNLAHAAATLYYQRAV